MPWIKTSMTYPQKKLRDPNSAGSLEEALNALDNDREFLTRGGVFTDDALDAYLELLRTDVQRVSMAPHPLEFEMYYSA